MSLVAAASTVTPPVPVIDLYHNSRVVYGNVTHVPQVLDYFQELIRSSHRVLLHHHTAYPIRPFLDRAPVYTTMVRDPVERFVSELSHTRALLRGDGDVLHQDGTINPKAEMEGRGWPRHLIEAAISEQVSFRELAELAIQEVSFRRYYYWNFYHLLLGRTDILVPSALPPDCPSDEAMAQLVRANFAYIGRFPLIYKSYFRIAQTFQIPVCFTTENFPHLLKRSPEKIAPELQEQLKAVFATEYAFLAALGFHFL